MSAKETIKRIVDSFNSKPYLKDKTQEMGDGLLLGASLADDANELSKDVQAQVDQLVVAGDSSVEAAQARVDASGKAYTTLKKRLDEKEQETTAQFQQNETDTLSFKQEINSKLQQKASIDYLESVLSLYSGGGVKDVFYSLAALNVAHPNGTEGPMLVYDVSHQDGAHQYAWVINKWKDIGLYNPAGIKNGSVTNEKLAKNYNFSGVLDASDNLNLLPDTGTFITVASVMNKPYGAADTALVHNISNDAGTYSSQFYHDIDGKLFIRIKTMNYGGYGSWKTLGIENLLPDTVGNETLKRNYNYVKALDGADDLDLIKDTGTSITIAETANRPKNSHPTSLVHNWSNDAGTYSTQLYHDIEGGLFSRIKSLNNSGYNGFKRLDNPMRLDGKTIVVLADSIFGNNDGPTSVSNAISRYTGAIVINCGFGGTRAGYHESYWDAFSFYQLAKAINTGDFSLQDQALLDDINNEMPTYFASRLARLKAINWTKVHGMITHYGRNDWWSDNELTNVNPMETFSYKGALRFGIDKFLTKYPELKVMISTPIYSTISPTENSDNKKIRDLSLIEFVDGAIDVAKEMHVSYVDNYRTLGFNKYNRFVYFPEEDGTHPNGKGNDVIAKNTSVNMINKF